MLLSKQRKEDSQICRKDPNGQFKCPSSEPVSTLLAIPTFPKSLSSILIQPSGNFWKESDLKINFIQNCIQGFDTSIANLDSTGLLGNQLDWGCSVFFQNELLVFGVNVEKPHNSDVSKNLYRLYRIADTFTIIRF